jgi:dTDP-4-dehydrorhamnose 3,5-epimerase
VQETEIPDVRIVVGEPFADDRGFFLEVFRQDVFDEAGLPSGYVQLNHSRSRRNVLRGLHFQWSPPMGKLMRVTAGTAFLVAVDIRVGSPTLGRWVGATVTADSYQQIWAPAGFARGFCALTDTVDIQYLCTGVYNGSAESGIHWNDPEIGIQWPVEEPIVSPKDADAQSLRDWLARPEAASFSYP